MNKVIVVGNNGSQINASTYVDLKKDLIIAEQQNPTDLDLYKEVELTSVSGQDEAGHPLYKANRVYPELKSVNLSIQLLLKVSVSTRVLKFSRSC